MKKTVPDEVILGLLKDIPSHGYELLERFRSREQLGRVWTMSTSQLYAVLKRLETQDLIRGQEVYDPNAPPRVVYTVTDAGAHRLAEWLYDPQPSVSIHRIRVLFISRLYIGSLLKQPLDEIIYHQKSVCVKQRQKLVKARKQTASSVEQLTLDFVIGQLETAIEWIENIPITFPIAESTLGDH